MENQQLKQQLKECAKLLYQNCEQEAYAMLNELLTPLNNMLQQMAMDGENGVVEVMKEFISAYQLKDNLALADILYYSIANE